MGVNAPVFETGGERNRGGRRSQRPAAVPKHPLDAGPALPL